MKQLKLFEATPHLESDYFLSGNPDVLDPYDGEPWTYDNYTLDNHPKLFNGELDYNNNHIVNDVGKVAVEASHE